ncbi:hypothetical protein VPH35_115567 [Triticum aestivum]
MQCQPKLISRKLNFYSVTVTVTVNIPLLVFHFLSRIYIDNLDLGIFNMKHDVFPRIKQFGEGMVRWMATMATDVGVAEPSFASASLRDPSRVSYRGRHAQTVVATNFTLYQLMRLCKAE